MTAPDTKTITGVRENNAEFQMAKGRKRLARVITFGCKMNDNDSEKIMGLLVEMGYEIEPSPVSGKFGNPAPLGALGVLYADDQPAAIRLPDLVILNTCCVRENAEQRFFGILGSLRRFKSGDPSRVLAVCGCMMQEDSVVQTISDKYGYVDFIFGTKSISGLPALLADVYRKQTEKYSTEDLRRNAEKDRRKAEKDRRKKTIPVMNALDGADLEDRLPVYRKAPPCALVSIMNGCDNFCSYCIVPFVRGREQSRTPDSVIDEAERLVSDGYREITLLGQNVNSYGKDLRPGSVDFAALLERLSEIDGLWRVRFMTSHPKDLSDRLIGAIRDLNAVCPQLHLPVQSGSSAVLKKMNRGYNRENYINLVRKIKNAVPDLTLTTDIIVGFPGESDADFDATLSLVREADFDLAYTFLYSPRKGTAAASYCGQVPDAIAKKRFERLLDIQNKISLEKNRSTIGSVYDILCEGTSKTNAERFTGRTPGGKVVNFRFDAAAGARGNNPDGWIGKIIRVRVEQARTWSLDGVAVSE